MKKVSLPKGFLSTKGNPTLNSIEMFMVYLSNVPKGVPYLVNGKTNDQGVREVRKHFNWNHDSGFSTMIMWGLNECVSKSTTSEGRYRAMKTARVIAENNLRSGVVITSLRMVS